MVSPDKSQFPPAASVPVNGGTAPQPSPSSSNMEGRTYSNTSDTSTKTHPQPVGPDKDSAASPPLTEKNVTPEAPNNDAAVRSYGISKKILGSKNIQELNTFIHQEHNHFDSANIIAAINRLADLKSKLPKERGKISPAASGEISQITEGLLHDIHSRIAQFSPEDLTKIIHALAPFNDLIKPAEKAKLSTDIMTQLRKPGFSIKTLATLSQSLSIIDPDNNKLFEVLATAIKRASLVNLTPMDFVALASSFCTRIPIDKDLVAGLAKQVERFSKEFTSDQIASLVDAFDKGSCCLTLAQSTPVFESLAKSAANCIMLLTSTQLASLCRAFSKFELERELINPVFNSNPSQGNGPQPLDMRTTFFAPAANALIQYKGIISPRSLSDITFSFAKMSLSNRPLFDHLANKMMESQRGKSPALESFGKEDLWRILWSYATVGIGNKTLVDKMITRMNRIMRELDTTAIGNILWSLAILDIRPDPKITQALVNMFSGMALKDISVRQAFAYYQQTTLPHPEGDYPLQWPPTLVAKFNDLKVGDVNISKIQAEVYAEVRKLQPEAVEERPIRKMPVDIAIKKVVDGKKVKVAIEIDGPTHFAYKSRDPLGHTQFKRRLLNRKGWQVISVPYWDWDAIKPGDMQAKAAYLKSLLPSEALKQQGSAKAAPTISKSAMKKARRAAEAQKAEAQKNESKAEAAPKPSKSAAKKARQAAAKAAAAAQKAQNVESDDEAYHSLEESDESVDSAEFNSATSSKEESKPTFSGAAGESSDSEDEGYKTPSEE